MPIFSKLVEKLKDLPVAEITQDVVNSVKGGKVTIVTAETGSGKTLLANSMLADAVDGPVVVLVPRRFLAINAAETVAELSGLEVGKEVGWAVGKQSGDESCFSPDTKLLFTTYGYALQSGLIETAKTIVADEVHESGVDTSLARALLHDRLQRDPSLRIVEMSATLNAKKQAAYWSDIAETAIHHADGKTFPCENRTVSPDAKTIEQVAIDLIREEDRKGIAIFRPGVGEVEKTAEELRTLLKLKKMNNVEVATIYGDMDMEERAAATRAPEEGNVKILIGTNVIESGVNIPWLDSGISDGTGKVPYYRRNGAEALLLEDLPQWRIVQQEGRVKRFSPGIFGLHSHTPLEGRNQQQSPEIERVSLTGLIMHAAHYDINPLELKYDGDVDKDAILRAKADLKRLGLMTEDWKLTEKGEYVITLPVGPEAGAMLYAAKDTPEILPDAIELAAVMEAGGLRADYREPHGFYDKSDVLDGLKAFQALGYEADEIMCESHNVSWKRYKEVRGLMTDLDRKHDIDPDNCRDATDRELTKLMLHGSVNQLFSSVGDQYRDLVRSRRTYDEARSTVTSGDRDRFAIGYLREFEMKDGTTHSILQNITKVPTELFLEFAAERGDILTDVKQSKSPKGRETFTAKYLGRSDIEFGVPRDISDTVKEFLGLDKSRGADKPSGRGNHGVHEVQHQQQRAV